VETCYRRRTSPGSPCYPYNITQLVSCHTSGYDAFLYRQSSKNSNKNFFWGICLNNPRFATNSRTDDKNCLLNPHYKSHKILEIKRVPDYILILYKKI
jgi:hypothetical protein